MKTSELFTPDGYSPALANLNTAGLCLPDVEAHVLATEEVVRSFAGGTTPEQILETVASTLRNRKRNRGDIGVEKPTHYAHLLASTNEVEPLNPRPGDTTVWLHDYRKTRSGAKRGGTTIEDPHTHRGGLTSILLSKGFIFTERRAPDRDDNFRPQAAANLRKDLAYWQMLYNVLVPEDNVYAAGDVMHLDPDEIHALKAVALGTLSLVVRTVERPFSTVWVPNTAGQMEPRIIGDMPSHRQEVAGKIGRMVDVGSA